MFKQLSFTRIHICLHVPKLNYITCLPSFFFFFFLTYTISICFDCFLSFGSYFLGFAQLWRLSPGAERHPAALLLRDRVTARLLVALSTQPVIYEVNKGCWRKLLDHFSDLRGNITAKGFVGIVTDGFSPACPGSSIVVVGLILTCSGSEGSYCISEGSLDQLSCCSF